MKQKNQKGKIFHSKTLKTETKTIKKHICLYKKAQN